MKEPLLTTKQIALRVGRSPITISSTILRLGLKPVKTENLGALKRHFYNAYQANKIFNYYAELDASQIKRKRKNLFPEVIYVHTIWEILPSKINYLNSL